ncbi:MerR family transcriptional regulator [Propionispora hippei]|uniref:DNA-binding transcriptional regulator, MerR family n=1 Tax=Propionispora hippei DSM 15287 TaxID=1123003 RepID=A0A1M6P8L8_9FIRM|nr:MerR family transcriptional regulator [Propionispora hippei]SHK04289.1 DNA-binding transcriptional regulator, MerR family [Propionispora hippei DSM 15287]
MYTVKEVAQKIKLTEHTIRFYTDKGLVPNVQRDKYNNRLFDEESLNWLIRVKYLKDCGMSIKDINHFVELYQQGDSSLLLRYEIILKYREMAREQLAEATGRLAFMEEKVRRYHTIIKQVSSNDTNT